MVEDPLDLKYHKEHTATLSSEKLLIRRLLSYLLPYRGITTLSIVFLFLAKCAEVLVPVYIGYTAQQIIDGVSKSAFERSILFEHIFQSCLIIFGLLLLGYLFDTISMSLKNWVGQKAVYTLRIQVYEHIQHFPLSYFDRNAVGRLMTRTIHDVDQISQMFSDSVVPIIGSLLLFLGICICLTIFDWKAAIVFAAVIPFVAYFTNKFRIDQRKSYDLIRNIVSAMNTFAQEHLMGASTVRNFGLQKQERQEFNEINQDNCEANIRAIHHFAFFMAMIDILQNFSLIFVFVALVTLSPAGTGFQVGAFFTFSLYALMFFRPLADLAERYNVLQSAMAAAERIFHILDEPIEVSGTIKQSDGVMREENEIHSITFEDVWFAYEKEHWIFKGLSFHIDKGESLALVGITGAGKTSLMSLLLRFYEFQKGSIKINGRDIREYPLNVLRNLFSVVLQDPVIFSGTLFENISLYQSDITQERIEGVIDYLNLRSFVERMPQGLQQILTERGKSLSTGEMQLISLARAIAQERSMLILDEATANIDTVTEQIIQNALKKVLKDKTSLVIAHRLSTIKDVNRILVLHNGVVAETGSHAQLLDKKGLYEKLYRVQFMADE